MGAIPMSDPFVYREDLVEHALAREETVLDVDWVGDTRCLYHAVQERDYTVWRATLDVDYYPDSDTTPSVKFARCHPHSDADVMQKWTSLATGRLSGPQDLKPWRRMFAVFEAAVECYEEHRLDHRRQVAKKQKGNADAV